jgi:hypothetical protein
MFCGGGPGTGRIAASRVGSKFKKLSCQNAIHGNMTGQKGSVVLGCTNQFTSTWTLRSSAWQWVHGSRSHRRTFHTYNLTASCFSELARLAFQIFNFSFGTKATGLWVTCSISTLDLILKNLFNLSNDCLGPANCMYTLVLHTAVCKAGLLGSLPNPTPPLPRSRYFIVE